MKRILIVFGLMLLLFGCSDDSDHKSEYYVKYHFLCSDGFHYIRFTANYTNEKKQTVRVSFGENTSNYNGSRKYEDEIICGPFKYGDNVSLSLTNQISVTSRLLEISVSKDNSPFALKESKNSSSISYTIDF